MKPVRTISLGIFLFVIVTGLVSCETDPPIPVDKAEPPVYGISFNVPQGWPQPVYNFQGNELTEDGFRLGRALFYDGKLSRDNTISCGSCHQQFAAFSHSAHSLSHGIDGLYGTRNAPALFNLNWHPLFMWDGGINHIEVQPLGPITNPVEMDEDVNNIIVKLNADAGYKKMFRDAFGDDSINVPRIFKALAQFMGMLNSSGSRYDQYMNGSGTLSSAELSGLNVFRQKCAGCHTEPLFSDFSFRNNGLSISPSLNDSGRAHITGDPGDKYKFKVPSLRNIALTSPYMHDGRFHTLDQCLDHYISGIVQTPNLDTSLANGIALTSQEKQDIISFLHTLTDDKFIHDERFRDPN